MSKTKRDITKGKYNAAYKEYDKNKLMCRWQDILTWQYHRDNPWNKLSHAEQMYIAPYSTPSWWNRLFNNRPQRRADNMLLRKYDINLDAECDAMFSINRKPHKYYW